MYVPFWLNIQLICLYVSFWLNIQLICWYFIKTSIFSSILCNCDLFSFTTCSNEVKIWGLFSYMILFILLIHRTSSILYSFPQLFVMWQWPSYCHKISLHLKVCFQTLTTYVGSSWCSVLITLIIWCQWWCCYIFISVYWIWLSSSNFLAFFWMTFLKKWQHFIGSPERVKTSGSLQHFGDEDSTMVLSWVSLVQRAMDLSFYWDWFLFCL